MLNDETLGAYLNDHRAGATAGAELLRRLAEADDEDGIDTATFARLVDEIESELEVLEQLMATLGIEHDRTRAAAGWLAEKASRLRLSEVVTGSADLTHMLEVEGIMLGVRAKRGMWEALRDVASREPRLATVDLDGLIAQARAQEDELDAQRRALAEAAFDRT